MESLLVGKVTESILLHKQPAAHKEVLHGENNSIHIIITGSGVEIKENKEVMKVRIWRD